MKCSLLILVLEKLIFLLTLYIYHAIEKPGEVCFVLCLKIEITSVRLRSKRVYFCCRRREIFAELDKSSKFRYFSKKIQNFSKL